MFRLLYTFIAYLLKFIIIYKIVNANDPLVNVQLGNILLRNNNYEIIKDDRVMVLSNPTGVFSDNLVHIVDDMRFNSKVAIVGIFSAEHGFRGEKQAETGDPLVYIDSYTSLPVFSAYKLDVDNITSVLLEYKVTAVVVDIQDVGVRLYTFIWTMYKVMQATANAGGSSAADIRFIICDRPNPLGGLLVDGPVLNLTCCASGYGRSPITHLHGMTIGELGLLFNSPNKENSGFIQPPLNKLEILHMTGWKREMTFESCGLPWVPPSPNIPTPASVFFYASTVFIEATTISEGRGTTTPFQVFGAPFLDPYSLSNILNEDICNSNMNKSYMCFRPAYYQPTFSKYNNTVVNGVQWVENRGETNFLSALYVLIDLKLSSPNETFQWDGSWFGHPGTELIDEYMGTPLVRTMIDGGYSAEDINAYFLDDIDNFASYRKQFLLY